jgi:hypothetical protein
MGRRRRPGADYPASMAELLRDCRSLPAQIQPTPPSQPSRRGAGARPRGPVIIPDQLAARYEELPDYR